MALQVSSKPGTLTGWDWIKTAILTAGTGLLSSVVALLQTGASLNWATFKPVIIASACAFAMSLVSRLSTNSEGKIASEKAAKADTDNP